VAAAGAGVGSGPAACACDAAGSAADEACDEDGGVGVVLGDPEPWLSTRSRLVFTHRADGGRKTTSSIV
jgi:hypothetical protein